MLSIKFASLITVDVVHACIIDACTHGGVLYLEEMMAIPCMRERTSNYDKPAMNMKLYPWYGGAQAAREKDVIDIIHDLDSEMEIPLFIRRQI